MKNYIIKIAFKVNDLSRFIAAFSEIFLGHLLAGNQSSQSLLRGRSHYASKKTLYAYITLNVIYASLETFFFWVISSVLNLDQSFASAGNNHVNSLSESHFLELAFVILLFFVLSCSRLLSIRQSYSFSADIATDIGSSLHSFLIHKYSTEQQQPNIQRFKYLLASGLSELSYNVIDPLSLLLPSFLASVGIISVTIITSYDSLIILFPAALAFVLYSFILRKKIFKLGLLNNESDQRYHVLTNDHASMLDDIRLYSRLDVVSSEFNAVNHRLRHSKNASLYLSSTPRSVVEATASLLALIVLFLMAFVLNANISTLVGPAIYLAVLSQRLLPLGQSLFWAFSSILKKLPLVKEYLNVFTEIRIDSTSDSVLPQNPAKLDSFEALPYKLICSSVGYSYGSGDSLNSINNFSLAIPSGCVLAVHGQSGIGKSTFARIISGQLHASSGTISLDNAGGHVDVFSELWPNYISMVSQKTYFPSTNVLGFLNTFHNDYDISLIVHWLEALRLPSSSDFLTADINTLSGGERLRLCTIRALLKKSSKIFILDEFTSALDATTEKVVVDTVYTYLRSTNKIGFIISHKRYPISEADSAYEIFRNTESLLSIRPSSFTINDGQF